MRFVLLFLALIILIPMIRGVLGALAKALMSWSVGPQRKPQGQGGPTAPPRAPIEATTLHKDPVCGTYVSESLAVTLRDGKETVWFCSTACCDKYRKGA
jgi:YHS domain-containing protein